MSLKSGFNRLPNEIYLMIFDYLNKIDLLYSFSNLNRRLNSLLKSSSRYQCKSIDLSALNPRVFQYYCLQKQITNEISSIKLTNEQFQLIKFPSKSLLRQLILLLKSDLHLHCNEQYILENLKKFRSETYALTWEKPLITFEYLIEIIIHLRSHSDLVELINCLPIVEKVHATINYQVTSCDNNNSLNLKCKSSRLIDFSYIIESSHGLVYFVTDYQIIELFIKEFVNLLNLRLYIIGCLNTTIDKSRLENNLLKNLSQLKQFHLFVQSYGGNRMKSMDEYRLLPWNFGSYTNDLTDMHFFFTLPYQFHRLDECLNEYFINSIQTTFTKAKNVDEYVKLLGMNNVKHVELSCNITLNLLNILKESFQSLQSIVFSSSTAEYLSPPLFFRESRYFLHSIVTVRFDRTCRNQSAFVRLLPNLNHLIIDQSLLNHLLEETGSAYICQVKQLDIYSFQRHFLQNIINAFPNLRSLTLKTLSTDDEGPKRSFIDHICHHKHRPVSVTDVLDDLLKGKLPRLKQIHIGCYFERDELNLQGILSRIIRKHLDETHQFNINCEDFKSTRCGTVSIFIF